MYEQTGHQYQYQYEQVQQVLLTHHKNRCQNKKNELGVVTGNIKVMGDMLTELDPSNVDPSNLELLQELNRTNRQMQQRLVDLLDKIGNEEVTSECKFVDLVDQINDQ